MGLGLLSAVAAFTAWWRRHPRFGADFVNDVVDPWLVRQGVIAESDGELGLIEHVGRVTGIVRRSPVHPVATEHGFRIITPLGDHSEWAQNVLAAGHCRLQVGSTIHELDEPALIAPSLVEELPKPLGRAMDWLGFRYLVLHRYAQVEGTFEPLPEAATTTGIPATATMPVSDETPAPEPVTAS
jgi:hypothetical protein